MNITIERESGTYRWADGVASPSVTHILRAEIPQIAQWSNDNALLRGRIVHKAIALLEGFGDGSGLAWDTLDAAYHGYVRAWEAFRASVEWQTIHAELPVRSTRYGYSGTPDLIGTMLHRRKRIRALCDLKTGQKAAWWALQTAAYQAAYQEQYSEKIERRFSLILDKAGSYDAGNVWTSAMDCPNFLTLLGAYRWKEANGYGNNGNRAA